jgi:hypothetical protein
MSWLCRGWGKWEPQHFTTMWVSMACYKDSFIICFCWLLWYLSLGSSHKFSRIGGRGEVVQKQYRSLQRADLYLKKWKNVPITGVSLAVYCNDNTTARHFTVQEYSRSCLSMLLSTLNGATPRIEYWLYWLLVTVLNKVCNLYYVCLKEVMKWVVILD